MRIARNLSTVLVVLVVLLLSATSSPAAAILDGSSFDISGTLTVSGFSNMTWMLTPSNLNKALVGSVTGSFAGLTGTEVAIEDLTNPPATVAAGFADQLFITFDAGSGLPTLLINYIYAGGSSSADCASAAAVGQSCTLAGSPFDFKNTPGGGSTATYVFSGVSSDGLTTWTGLLTSQFSVPYQTVFAELASTGSITNTYSATFVASAASVPEPATWSLALGAICILAGCWRRKRTET